MFVVKPWVLVLGAVAVAGLAILLLTAGGDPGRPVIATDQPALVVSPDPISVTTTVPTPPMENASTESPDEPRPIIGVDGIIYPGEYPRFTDAAGFGIHWANDNALLRMGLVSPGTGYVAIGFDPDDRMQGADFILGAVSGGRTISRDDVGNGPYSHAPDTALGGRDNIIRASGREANGQTVFEFVIPLHSGDAMDKRLVPGQTYTVLVAYHQINDDFDAKHSRRGTGEIRLEQ